MAASSKSTLADETQQTPQDGIRKNPDAPAQARASPDAEHSSSDLDSSLEPSTEPSTDLEKRSPAQDGASQPPPDPESTRTALETTIIVAALCSAIFLAALDMTIVTTAVPTIAAQFQSSAGYVWIGTAYMLANAAFAPTWGKISDIFGRKPVMLVAVAVFWVGSLLCGLSNSIGMMLAGRAVQGLGGGGVIVLANICVGDLFSARTRGLYYGVFGGVWAVASAVGPVLGGVFTTKATWRWCFYVNLPISGVAFFILMFVLRLHNPRTPIKQGLKAVDWVGSVLIIGGTVMLLLGLEFGGVTYPWSSPTVICLIVFGVFTIGLFGVYEAYVPEHPVMPARIFQSKSNIAALAVVFCHGFTFIAGSYWLPLYFQAVLGVNALMSGVYLLPYVMGLSLTSIFTGIIIKKTGNFKMLIVGGETVMTIGFGLLLALSARQELAKLIIFQIIAGLGVGPNFQSPLIALHSHVAPHDIATTTATMGFVRQLSTAISIVVGSVVFSNGMQNRADYLHQELGQGQDSLVEQLSGANAAANADVVAGLTGRVGEIVKQAFWESMRDMFIVYVAMAAVGVVAAVLVRQRKLSTVHQEHKTGLSQQKTGGVAEEVRKEES